jgi:hypothetical protein
MSWTDSQFVPDELTIRTVFDTALRPITEDHLRRFECGSIRLRISIWKDDCEASAREETIALPTDRSALVGELRLRFRSTFKPERALFFAHLRLAEPIAANGWSGFSCRGSVKKTDTLAVQIDPIATQYNVHTWSNPS